MATSTAVAAHKSTASVTLEVSGGRQTSSTYVPQISNEDFTLALRRSIEQSGAFARVASAPPADYRMIAYIGQLDSPMMGMTVRVDMEVGYQLIDVTANRPVWRKSIKTQYTVPSDKAYAFVDRVRIGNEAAARMNIEQMLAEVAALKLP
ncbi:MAG TPA: hypothetical protein PLW72_08425 [Burkholderiaceae bacterium]|nr:hypothetical protein [Burkholderiaceae bacterium]HQR75767.1 hypothetical protein [Burkholderiaceae bacterium]